LLGLLLGGLSVGCCSATACLAWDIDELGRARKALISVFSDRRRVRALGTAYAKAATGGSLSPARLTRAILGATPMSRVAKMSTAAIQQMITERIRLDFSDNNTVCVQGWILSKTEARLYALAAMDQTFSG
jgi:hypothetical protein